MTKFIHIDSSSLRIHGFCPWASERVVAEIESGANPTALPGDCIVTASAFDQDGPFELLMSSVLSCHNYYWHSGPLGFFHGTRLFDILARAGLYWRWNSHALLSLLVTEFTTDTDTLHADIHRLRPATCLIYRNGLVSEVQSSFWDDIFSREGSSMSEAAEMLRAIVQESSQSPCFLSLSAGFDSRVILALLVSLGVSPVVGTMGYSDSTDVVVASAIAKHYNLEHRRVALKAEDYLEYAPTITAISGGTKTADHWHTYIYINKVGFDSAGIHWAGSNGEMARTTWFDRNPLARLLDRLPVEVARLIVARRFHSGPYTARFQDALDLVPDQMFGQAIEDVPKRFASLLGADVTGLNQLDRFVTLHPTRHFIGNGLSLYASVVRTHSPFLDIRWIELAARLPRRDRVGSNFHRYVLSTFAPDLLQFPIGREPHIRHRAPWNFGNPKGVVVPYATFDKVLSLPACQEILRESPHLQALFPHRRLIRAIEKKNLAPVLLALHFAAEVAATTISTREGERSAF